MKLKVRDLFPIRGFMLLDDQLVVKGDHYQVVFTVQDPSGKLAVVLRIPKTDERGVYDIEGIPKVMIKDGRPSLDYPKHPNLSSSIWVRDPNEIVLQLAGHALEIALVSAVHGNPPAEQAAQDVIDKFFATSPLLRQVDPDKKLDLEMTQDTIHIDISGDSLDPNDRLIKDWCGIVDPLTTPQGSRAMQTYRLARGARVENGRFIRGHRVMSESMERNLVFPENDWPARLLITRTAIAKHEEIVRCEDPWVHHVRYRPGDLRGIHLMTGIMGHKYNYQDCVVLSATAA